MFSAPNGSHAIYVRQSDQARVVIPMHKGELKRKTLRGIIQDVRISVEEFANLLLSAGCWRTPPRYAKFSWINRGLRWTSTWISGPSPIALKL